jgi:hypothetical protein
VRIVLVLVLVFAVKAFGAEPIRDEALRLRALMVLFPGMSIAARPDGLYTVSGPVTESNEFCASTGVQLSGVSRSRVVRLWLFPWPIGTTGTTRELLAILHYNFSGIQPRCESVTWLAHLTWMDDNLVVLDREDLFYGYQLGLRRLEVQDLTGDGFDELLLEATTAESRCGYSYLLIYSLSGGFFDKVLLVCSQVDCGQERWRLDLDIRRTVRERGKRFCFVKTSQNKVSRLCYPSMARRQ